MATKVRRLLLPLALGAVGLSCSCLADFAVVNRSSASVFVTFALPPGDSTGWPGAIAMAAGTTAEELKDGTWATLSEDSLPRAVQRDSATRLVRLELPPNHALRVGSIAADCAGGIFGVDAPSRLVIEGGARTDTLRIGDIPRRVRALSRALYVYEIGS